MRSPSSARSLRAVRFLLACALIQLVGAQLAHAIDAQPGNATELARQRFQEATQAYQEGRYSAAASLFEAADRLVPHASTRYNAATAWEQAGEDARAATGYEAALGLDSLDPGRRKAARERLAGLELKLGRVHIREPVGALVTVDHVQRAPVPITFYLRPGNYDIRAEYRGSESTTNAPISAGADREIKLDLPLEATPAEASEPVSVPLPTPPAPRAPDDGRTQQTWGWVSAGASIALGGAAIFLGVRALSARDRYVASGNTNANARHEASNLRLATNLLWGGATLAGSTGLVLLLTAPTVEF